MHKEGKKGTLMKVLRYIRPYMHYVILSLLFAALSVILTLYAPILLGEAIDCIVGKGNVDFGEIFLILEKTACVIIVTGIAQWLMNLCNNQITYGVVKDIRLKAFKKLENLPLSYVDSHASGDTISRIITDVEQFSDGLLMGFSQFFTGAVTILATLLFMLSIDVKISLVVVLITPLSFFVAGFIAKRTYMMFKKQSETRAKMTSLVNEMVGNQKVVQAFGYGRRASKRFDEINDTLKGYSLRAIFFSSITNPSTRFVNNLVYMGVGITGALSAITGAISVGQLSCFLTYANQYTKPFNEISGVVTELQNAFACAKRVFDFMEEEPETPDDADAVVLKEVEGNLSLCNVSFSYKKETPLLKDLNHRRADRMREDDSYQSPDEILRCKSGRDPDGGDRYPPSYTKESERKLRHGPAGDVAEISYHRGKYRIRQARCHDGRNHGGGKRGSRPQFYHENAGRLRHNDFRGRWKSFPGAEAAPLYRPCHAPSASGAHSG